VTLKCIVGLLQPDIGEVSVDGERVSGADEENLLKIRRKCGMVFQNPALLDSLTVRDNLSFGIRAHQLCESEEAIEARVREKMKLVNLDANILGRYPSELSFGMQKRVSIARTLAVEPDYLLFDEPTTGQDPVTTNAINQLILKLSLQLQVTSLIVSHDMECALEIADRIMLLDDGEVVEEGSPQVFVNSPQPLAREFMSEAFARGWGIREDD